MVKIITYPFIIFMKTGFHSGETLQQIIQRKVKEEQDAEIIFWGYNGKLCHPLTIRAFVEQGPQKEQIPKLVMTFTPSKPFIRNSKWTRDFSINNKEWFSLPEGINVRGSKYTIICNNLRVSDKWINLNAYEVATGSRKGTKLFDYIRYRIDKACAVYTNNLLTSKQKLIQINYVADLKEPYIVFLR